MSIFFVYINRQGIPKKRHKSIESARTEALRLHMATEGRRAVYVLGVLETLAALPQPDPSPQISSKTGREILRLKKSDGKQSAVDEFAKLIVSEVAAVGALRRM